VLTGRATLLGGPGGEPNARALPRPGPRCERRRLGQFALDALSARSPARFESGFHEIGAPEYRDRRSRKDQLLDTNALPLLLTIYGSFTEKPVPTLQQRIVHAAVHGWMEGHLAAPDHQLDPEYVGEMPSAPFPDPHDRRLEQIIKETSERFGDGEEPAAVAFAAALGWKQGRAAGQECPGCALQGHEHPAVRAMRSGEGKVEFRLPDGSYL